MTNTTTKMTRAQYFAMLATLVPADHEMAQELTAFLAKEQAQASKKHTESEQEKAEKEKAKQALRTNVLGVLMEASEPVSATAVGQALGLSTQKVTPALRELLSADMAVCVKVKGKNLYSVA